MKINCHVFTDHGVINYMYARICYTARRALMECVKQSICSAKQALQSRAAAKLVLIGSEFKHSLIKRKPLNLDVHLCHQPYVDSQLDNELTLRNLGLSLCIPYIPCNQAKIHFA